MIKSKDTGTIPDLMQAFDSNNTGDALAICVEITSDFVGGGGGDQVVWECLDEPMNQVDLLECVVNCCCIDFVFVIAAVFRALFIIEFSFCIRCAV